jgi:dynein heavy chain 1
LKTISKTVTNNSGKDSGQRNFEEKALADINEAYNQFLSINVLDISKEGQDMWESTKRNYDTKIDRVE